MTTGSYIVVTPARNEERFLPATIRAMAGQTFRPALWVLVDDGSTDATGRIMDEAAAACDWVRVVHRTDRGFRKAGAGVVEAFYEGFRTIGGQPWEFLVKLDGDLAYEADYFERCLARFAADPVLGIAGGTVCKTAAGGLAPECPDDPPFHVRGATKIYRRTCWEQIGGLIEAPGWDTVDELKASMCGWRTLTFPELRIHQLKETGTADGAWRNWVKNGLANYISGYHPLFMLAKCLRRLASRPYVMGAAGLWWGFCQGYLRNVRQVEDDDLIRFVRRQQLNKLLLRPSLW
jgi:glycosyltransferase involved in cell wall biosynthesis